MKRTERKIYTRCIAIMAAYIIAGVYFYNLPCDAKFAPLEAFEETDGNFTEESAIVAKTWQIREDTGISGMPCESPEQFARFLETYEQETEEETTGERTEVPTETEAERVRVPSDTEEVETEVQIFAVGNEVLNPELQVLMYDALDRHGIAYWYEIGLCQLWQESHGYIYAVNPVNNEDMGVLQYKNRYWDWSLGDIFDPAVQIELYAEQMANRLNQGLSVEECISRHKTSDFCPTVDWQYVAEVKQHLSSLREVTNY